MALIFLKEIQSVTRTDLKPYCIEIVTKDKTYYVACKSDNELYSWMDEIYNVMLVTFSRGNLPRTDQFNRDHPWVLRVRLTLFMRFMLVLIQYQVPLR